RETARQGCGGTGSVFPLSYHIFPENRKHFAKEVAEIAIEKNGQRRYNCERENHGFTKQHEGALP
ncbi:MAG: hypothetical protein IJ521_05625, partial [Schwartzia sp.]|nr:hypothetical protein [Schwartzia sp. (in: firmicutes)]